MIYYSLLFIGNRMRYCGFRRNHKWSWQFHGNQERQVVSEIGRPVDQKTAQVRHNWHLKSESQQRYGPQF